MVIQTSARQGGEGSWSCLGFSCFGACLVVSDAVLLSKRLAFANLFGSNLSRQGNESQLIFSIH